MDRSSSSSRYQSQECVLYGSVLDAHRDLLMQRLKGLCDPGFTEFAEHEMIFSLRTGTNPDVTIRLRRKIDQTGQHQWHFRYIGTPESDVNCPTIIRKTIDSLVYSKDMMDFVKVLGLRADYEFMSRGHLFTKGRVKVIVSKVTRPETIGHYDQGTIKPITESNLVETSITLPDSTEYHSAAKALREFADQLRPICEMQNVEYWRSLDGDKQSASSAR